MQHDDAKPAEADTLLAAYAAALRNLVRQSGTRDAQSAKTGGGQ